MNMLKISVVIPLYNKVKYIQRTIKSVLNQTFSDFEIVVVDDGSTDGSISAINNYCGNNAKVRIISKENGGPSSARNRGVIEANGEWIVFLDADDILLPFALDYFWKLRLENPDIDYFIGNFFMMTSTSISLASRKKHEGLITNPFLYEAKRELTECTGSGMYKRDILLSNPYDETLRRYEDAECQYRLLRDRIIYMSHIPVMITDRTAFSASSCRNNSNEEFGGHLTFKGKTYWEQMCLYLLLLDFKCYYKDEAEQKYGEVLRRMDLKVSYFYLKCRKRLMKLLKMLSKEKEYKIDFLMSNKDYSIFL